VPARHLLTSGFRILTILLVTNYKVRPIPCVTVLCAVIAHITS
jgi:hypothetical protein